jgi:phosphate-selective porin OprO and OprP
MDVRTNRWLALGLAVAVGWLGSGLAQAEGISPAVLPMDSGYATQLSTDVYAASTTVARYDRTLADEVAELKAWKAQMESKAAADKKKAAGKPSVIIGGRIFADTAMFDQNANSVAQVGDIQNGTIFRSTRLFCKGSMFDVIDYKLQFDLAGQTSFKDVYVAVKELPLVGNVRLGHFKEPFGMEQLTSIRLITFMERAPGDAGVFVPARNMGIMAYDCTENERMTWAIGAFVSEQGTRPPFYQEDHEGAALTMRSTFTPWYDEATEGRGVLHTGVAYSYRALGDETTRLIGFPESVLAGPVIDTGVINASDMQLFGAELAFAYGPFSFQSEYYGATINEIGADDLSFNGCYAYFSYFLTGENRRYNRKAGTFTNRIIPYENFFRVRDQDGCVQMGKGAWELAYRYSYVDLDDGQIQGGRVSDHTFGVNWYLNPYTRVMWNYINSTTDRAGVNDGIVNIFQMRAQVDF